LEGKQMIVREKPGLWDLLTALRGSIVPRVAGPVAVLGALAALVVALDRATGKAPHLDGSAFAVFGIGLSLFLGFRNNAAYDRWWEARRLWGGLLADMRSLAREVEVFLEDPAARGQVLRQALVFLHAHRLNLRRLSPRAPGQEAVADASHPPDAALDRLNAILAQAHREGQLDGFGARALTARLGSMALQQAGCERIANSPLPFVYSLLIYRTTYLYCLLLPLALIGSTGWMTPVFVAVVAYMFLGLAEVTEELSHPFAPSQNGIALDAICRAAEISLAPHLGEDAPPPLQPVDHYLS
jgi:ion channel-forming bestrophin family protein